MTFAFLKISIFFLLGIAVLIGVGVGFIRLIDYFEENPYGSKELIRKIVYTSMALHILFLFTGMPILHILFSLAVQYCYNCLFNVYPFVRLEDPKFIAGLLGSLINYFLMLRFFTIYEKRILLFIPYLCIIWATPICFFFSMTATEDALFIKKGGRKTKTYAGLLIDWIFTLGGKARGARQ